MSLIFRNLPFLPYVRSIAFFGPSAQSLSPLEQIATIFPRKGPYETPWNQPDDPNWARKGAPAGCQDGGGYRFSQTHNSKSVSKRPPLFVTSKGGALDVTISLRAFLGKMASVRQILPRAPSKDTLSDLNAVRPSHYQPGFACLSRLCQTTFTTASRPWRLALPAKLRDPRFRARPSIQLKGSTEPSCRTHTNLVHDMTWSQRGRPPPRSGS